MNGKNTLVSAKYLKVKHTLLSCNHPGQLEVACIMMQAYLKLYGNIEEQLELDKIYRLKQEEIRMDLLVIN